MAAEITVKTFFGTLAGMTALLIGMMTYLIGGVEDRITRMEIRMDSRFEQLIERFDGRLDRLEERMDKRFDRLEDRALGMTPPKKKH